MKLRAAWRYIARLMVPRAGIEARASSARQAEVRRVLVQRRDALLVALARRGGDLSDADVANLERVNRVLAATGTGRFPVGKAIFLPLAVLCPLFLLTRVSRADLDLVVSTTAVQLTSADDYRIPLRNLEAWKTFKSLGPVAMTSAEPLIGNPDLPAIPTEQRCPADFAESHGAAFDSALKTDGRAPLALEDVGLRSSDRFGLLLRDGSPLFKISRRDPLTPAQTLIATNVENRIRVVSANQTSCHTDLDELRLVAVRDADGSRVVRFSLDGVDAVGTSLLDGTPLALAGIGFERSEEGDVDGWPFHRDVAAIVEGTLALPELENSKRDISYYRLKLDGVRGELLELRLHPDRIVLHFRGSAASVVRRDPDLNLLPTRLEYYKARHLLSLYLAAASYLVALVLGWHSAFRAKET